MDMDSRLINVLLLLCVSIMFYFVWERFVFVGIAEMMCRKMDRESEGD